MSVCVDIHFLHYVAYFSLATLLDIIFKNDEFPLTQQSTVAEVQEKYIKDDENIDD